MNPILVTGGAKGVGAQICRQLASAGHDLVIHYRYSEKEAHQLLEECRKYSITAHTFQGDFSSIESTQKFIDLYLDRFPQTKGLVNNVGNYLSASALETPTSQWLDLFQTNFFTPIFLIQALMPTLCLKKGSIVNIGLAGVQRAFTKTTAYAATKAALLFYTRSLAKEIASLAVRVNMVSPGHMENSVDLKVAELPFKRAAHLSEVARTVVYLFDPQSAYITGQNIEVAGAFGL